MRKSSVYLATVAALQIGTPSLAQVASDSVVAPEATEVSEAGEIIVTATRRAQNLQDVPVAVNVVSEAQVKALSLLDTRDLVRLVPSLTFSQGSTSKLYNFTIRGIGSYVTSDAFDQSVGVAVDGVPLARPGGSIADLVDIERVEVLEGPQGMLFGRNASAGLVNIITRRPELGRTSFTGRASYGSYDETQLSGTVNIPLGDTLAARASAWRFRHDGYITVLGQDRKIGVKNSGGGRLRLLWKPDDRLSVNLTGEITSADQDPSVTTLRAFANGNFGVLAYETAQGIVASPTNRRTSSNHTIANEANSKSITADVGYEIGDHVLSSVTSYRRISVYDKYDPASTGAPTYVSDQADDIRYNQFSQELRLNADTGRLRYVLGLIYFNLDIDDFFFAETAGNTPTRGSVNVQTDISSVHYGAFGEFTFDATPELRVIAGGRISHDRIKGDFDKAYRLPPLAVVPPFNGPGAAFGPYQVSTSVTDTEPSYRFGLQYDISRDVMVYGTASRGYKAAGLDLVFVLTPATFNVAQSRVKPEIAKNLELGIRSQFFDKRLTINATAFAQTFNDFQIAVRLPTNATIFAVQNAKEMKSTGFTVQLETKPTEGLSVSASLAYINARYTDFVNAPCYPRQPTGPVGTPPTPGICVGGVQNLNGKPLANSPRWRYNATARYDLPIGEFRAFAQANMRYQSKEVFNAVADPFERQGGFSTVNLTAGFGPEDGSWQLSAFGSNIFDKSFIARTVPQNAGSYYSQVVPYDANARFGIALDVSF